MDKMSSYNDGDFPPFNQHSQFDYNFMDSQPLVFSFDDEDSIPADSPGQDAELDPLWAEFDFALESENIGTYYDDEVRFVLLPFFCCW
jgi:DNA repair and recombination RAD54-like protein